ncbi:Nephrocystin-3 [Stylophora pistillata]|uniref:Nephrocystin-3 n=1 Tax=Stylophora pistillata TaxID=50429 RepID=A0A2B4RUQ1_STYPI|nr:Nephrocystin-3 [Stylophora pistillata]
MALQPFADEQLNYFKFASIVLNEFPIGLRQTFKSMWDNLIGHRPGYQLWDDSTVVRNLFLAEKGGKTKVSTHLSYEEWDCTALFQATIHARSFATPDSKGYYRTLGELYVRYHKVPPGKFHAYVVSPSGNRAETFALAIDQLRLFRNTLCHSDRSEIDKPTFDQYVKLAKEAFKAVGVKTDPIDATGGLAESDFPTKEVRRLEESLRQETRSYIECLEELRPTVECLEKVRSSVDELIAQGNVIKGKVEDLALLEQKIDDLKQNRNQDHTPDSKPFIPPSSLPSKIPHFTGRQRECEEISSHLTSKGTRIVSLWGSPGFGKTSVATTVGHQLHSGGLPVYFFSMRGLPSKADLTWKLLSFFKRHSSIDQIPQGMSIDDELSLFLSEISDEFVMILDNADDLLESGVPNVREDCIKFLEVIVSQVQNASFLITTRESLEFMDVHFQGHHPVRIRPLDEFFSQSLVGGLLPSATMTDCSKIAKICGNVPLAMKLLCSSISEDNAQPSQFLKELGESTERNVFDLLDKPDYPSNLRLNFLFETSFTRLSLPEKEALVSLSVLSEDFNLSVAAAVLDVKSCIEAKKVLHEFRRKSLLDSSCKPDSFSMHKLLLSFARERGEDEMKETIVNSKARLSAFYVSLFEKLNEQFLKGNSMQAFIDFFEQEQNIIHSLMESCSDPMTCVVAFGVLTKAEVFVDSLFWCEEATIHKIYDYAIKAAQKFGENVFYSQLLVSLAFAQTKEAISNSVLKICKEIGNSSTPHSIGLWNFQRNVNDTLSNVTNNPKVAVKLCKTRISYHKMTLNQRGKVTVEDDPKPNDNLDLNVHQEGLLKNYLDHGYALYRMQNYSGAIQSYQCALDTALGLFGKEHSDTAQSYFSLGVTQNALGDLPSALLSFQRALDIRVRLFGKEHTKTIESSFFLGETQHALGDFSSALQSFQRALDKSVKLFGEEHTKTAESSFFLGETQHALGDFSSALLSHQHALEIKVKLFGEEHTKTAQSYFSLGVTQHALSQFSSALQSKQRALEVRVKIFGEEHLDTVRTYFSLGLTQHALGDFSSALRSHQRSLDIRNLKLFGDEHLDTADSYFSLGVTQHALGDFSSALQSSQLALDIRVKLFGEEHLDVAESYFSLGVTQHALGDFSLALQSKQRALEIRVNHFEEEHPDTAESYFSLGITQHALGDFSLAVQSKQSALKIRDNLIREEHVDTPKSYFSLGKTQHALGDFLSALQSFQHALDIRVELFGEEHLDTAQSYFSLGVTQHALGDFSLALHSHQRALDVRVEHSGEEHSDTAESYFSLGETQHALGDFSSALQSKQRALDIIIKLLGEEHPDTAESYLSLGETQHALGNFSSALQSQQRAFDITIKLFGKEHPDTAESCFSLGVTQHALGDFSSALQSKQRALEIRIKLFGEGHPDTARSYYTLGVTKLALCDFSSAVPSFQRAFNIRVKLFGEGHPDSELSYCSVSVAQRFLGESTSAVR